MADIAVNNTDADAAGKTLLLAEVAATVSALHTFNLGASAPFAVVSGAAKVVNLDADKLDGVEGADYARISAANTLAGVQTGTNQPCCQGYNNAAQTITNNTETALTFPSEDHDIGGLHEAVTHPTRFTAVVAGVYLAIGEVQWVANATGVRELHVKKNNASDFGDSVKPGHATIVLSYQVLAIVQLAVGDYVEFTVKQTSGGNLDTAYAQGDLVKLW